ncbi:MAG: acylphosphatase [Candidatus Omnitrophota bacterium]|nr:acylphosphatase [Candidatus Omnitrophota bacterium]
MDRRRRFQVIYHGTVQGVGFRFTVNRIAQNLAMNGYVRNMPDGSVEMVCEGPVSQAETFIRRIDESMSEFISERSVKTGPDEKAFTGFGIRF